MPFVTLCWPRISEVDVGGMAVEVEPSHHFVAVWQMAAEGPSNKMTSHMEVRMKCRYGKDFLHAEKTAPIEIHPCLLSIYGD